MGVANQLELRIPFNKQRTQITIVHGIFLFFTYPAKFQMDWLKWNFWVFFQFESSGPMLAMLAIWSQHISLSISAQPYELGTGEMDEHLKY